MRDIINRIVYLLNKILVVITIIGFVLPYLAPKLFPLLSVFTLILPALFLLNLIMVVYWLIQLNKRLFLSLLVYLIGTLFFGTFYKIKDEILPREEEDFVVMSYNVRLFNVFKWIEDENVSENIMKFIEEQNPDIICFQEYSKSAKYSLEDFPYRHIVIGGNQIKTGSAIFSKYRIINNGEITFPNSNNNVIYADIVKDEDTIRVYNMHLQSINISVQIQDGLKDADSQMLLSRLSNGFREQQLQSELIRTHMKDFTGKKILCGDMNNTAYSYTYMNIRGQMKDAFLEAGKGFGKTYNYTYYPARIDYIFADEVFEIKEFMNFPEFKNSDHYPIISRLKLSKNTSE